MKNATVSDPVAPIEPTDREVAFYRGEGYLVLPAMVASQEIAALREEVLDVLDANGVTRASLSRATSSADKLRQQGQFLRGSRLEALIYSAAARRIAERLLGGSSTVYLPFTAVKAGGGGGQFHFHQDNQYTRHEPGTGSINIWIALDDMAPENGCLCVCPRSHLGGQLASTSSGDGDTHKKVEHDPTDHLPVRMRAGDAVAFSRLTVHGSGPNETDRARVAYALQYHHDDTAYYDPQTGELKRLKDEPRWRIGPVDKLG